MQSKQMQSNPERANRKKVSLIYSSLSEDKLILKSSFFRPRLDEASSEAVFPARGGWAMSSLTNTPLHSQTWKRVRKWCPETRAPVEEATRMVICVLVRCCKPYFSV